GAAGVVVLDDDHRRAAEFADEVEGAVQVEEVVVGEFLAVQDFRPADAGVAGGGVDVEGGLLVRVLAVAEDAAADAAQVDDRREGALALQAPGEPVADGRVVGGDAGEGLGGQAFAAGQGQGAAVFLQLVQDGGVLGGGDDDGDVVVVLGG